MSTELISTEFPLPKNAYTAFDAISLRNLIIERLNQQNLFTDQNYIGSNLAAVIDIVSYAFNTLIFYLNRTSTESMFTEAQLYENISKIVKLLDYKPIGYQTSTLAFQCSADNLNNTALDNFNTGKVYIIPRYSYLTIGNIQFSFNEDVSFAVTGRNAIIDLVDISNRKLLYQGIYRENPLYTAAGDPNETIIVNSAGALVDHFNIDVYVFEQEQQRWIQYQETPNLYTEQAYNRKFEKRLNSNLLYEISFGNNSNGRQLKQGDLVAIYYLQSTGETAVVGPNSLANFSSSRSTYDTVLFSQIIADVKQDVESIIITDSLFRKILFDNVAGSTIPKPIEQADSIRKNAPLNFRSQYRLVTREDYENFIKINFTNLINDVKVFTNWDYVSKYLKYFKDIQVGPTAFRQILLNQVQYADSCNFNNIYICCVPKISEGSSLKYLLPAQKELIISNILPLKVLTAEINFMDPIYKALSFGAKTNIPDLNVQVLEDQDFIKVELIKTPGNNRNNASIISDAVNIFSNFFDPSQQTIGSVFRYNDLTSQILSIDGVSSIRTKRTDTNETVDGFSFYIWNPSFPELDRKVITGNVTLSEFEFLYFDGLSTLAEKFIVVEDRYTNTRF